MQWRLNMRIAVVNSEYSRTTPSGETYVVNSQIETLTRAGHDVLLITLCTDDLIVSRFFEIKAGLRVMTGYGSSPLREILAFEPDLVHIHNLFPNFGFRWVKELKIPLVVTIHNYRQFCANGLLYLDGHSCQLCPSKNNFFAVKNKCYGKSTLKTLPLAIANEVSKHGNVLLERADAIIVLTHRFEEIFSEFVPIHIQEKVLVIPNFYVTSESVNADEGNHNKWIYAGRLSSEKGIVELIEGWKQNSELLIFGDGPLRSVILEMIADRGNINYGGMVSQSRIDAELEKSKRFVFSSKWSEGNPIAFLQGMAASANIVTTRGNSVGDFVRAHDIGITVPNPALIGEICSNIDLNGLVENSQTKQLFEEYFSQRAWMNSIQRLYESVIPRS